MVDGVYPMVHKGIRFIGGAFFPATAQGQYRASRPIAQDRLECQGHIRLLSLLVGRWSLPGPIGSRIEGLVFQEAILGSGSNSAGSSSGAVSVPPPLQAGSAARPAVRSATRIARTNSLSPAVGSNSIHPIAWKEHLNPGVCILACNQERFGFRFPGSLRHIRLPFVE